MTKIEPAWSIDIVVSLSMCHLTGDCHDLAGKKDTCVSGAIYNYSEQLAAYQHPELEEKCVAHLFWYIKFTFWLEALSGLMTIIGSFVRCR